MPRWKIEGDPNSLLDALKVAEKAMDQHARNGGRAWDGFNDRTTRGVQRTTSAMESMYSRTTRSITNAVKSIPVPGLGPVGALGGAAIVLGIQKMVGDVTDAAKSIKDLQIVTGGTTEQVARLVAVGGQFGITADKLSDSARNLASAVALTPEKFAALGVATKNADGSQRELIDILTDTRRAFSEAKGGADTMRVAQELFKGSVGDLLPWLRASEEQITKVQGAAERAGLVMTRDAVDGALRYKASMDSLNRSLGGVAMQIGNNLIPWLAKAAEAAMVAGDMIGGLFTTKTWEGGDIPVIGGIGNWYKNIADVTFGNQTDALKTINDQVNAKAKMREEFQRLMAAGALGGAGNDISGALDGAGKGAADAIRDRIEAVRELADEEERRLRRALDGFEKERRTAIDAIREQQDAREKAHESAIDAIEDEVRAAEQAFELGDRARSDEIAGLRDQVRATSELLELEKDRQDVAEAEKDLAHERTVVITREGFRSALDYYRAVSDQNKRVQDAETRLSDAKKKLAQDEARARIEARINALEREGELEKRALDDYKTAAEERIRKIREQMAAEKEQADERLKQLQGEIDKERERVSVAIQNLQDETRVTIAELQKRLAAHQAAASAARQAWAGVGAGGGAGGSGSGGGNSATADDGPPPAGQGATRQDVINAYRTLLGRDPENEGAITGRIGMNVNSMYSEIFGSAEAAAYLARRRGETRGTESTFYPGPDGSWIPPHQPGLGGQVHDFPHTMTFGEPVVMVGRSGKNYGEIAKTGAEDVTFHGVGGRRGGAGGVTLNVGDINVSATDLRTARRMLDQRLDDAFEDLEAELAAENSYGYRAP